MASGFILTVVTGPLISTTDNQTRKDIRRSRTESETFTASPPRYLLIAFSPVPAHCPPPADCWQLEVPKTGTRRTPVTLTAWFLLLLPGFRHFGSSAFIPGCYRPLTTGSAAGAAKSPHSSLLPFYRELRKLRGTSADTGVSLFFFLRTM